MVSDILLGRTNPTITQAALDNISRQTGAEDQNNDGVVDYADVYGIQMKDTVGVSKVVPAVSGYIASVHAGDESKKRTALKNIAKTENHLLLTIIPNPDSNNHTPALKIQSIS